MIEIFEWDDYMEYEEFYQYVVFKDKKLLFLICFNGNKVYEDSQIIYSNIKNNETWIEVGDDVKAQLL